MANTNECADAICPFFIGLATANHVGWGIYCAAEDATSVERVKVSFKTKEKRLEYLRDYCAEITCEACPFYQLFMAELEMEGKI